MLGELIQKNTVSSWGCVGRELRQPNSRTLRFRISAMCAQSTAAALIHLSHA